MNSSSAWGPQYHSTNQCKCRGVAISMQEPELCIHIVLNVNQIILNLFAYTFKCRGKYIFVRYVTKQLLR